MTVTRTVDDFRKYVQQAVDLFKQGDLFMKCGLGETDVIIGEGEDVPAPGNKKHNFNIFLNHVAGEVVKQTDWATSKKSTLKMLQSFSSDWITIIQTAASPKKKKKKMEDEEESNKEVEDEISSSAEPSAGLTERQQQLLNDAKERFEREKESILADIPDEVKARFGQLYFAPWNKKHLPCLVLSPFSVGTGVRNEWSRMVEKVS